MLRWFCRVVGAGVLLSLLAGAVAYWHFTSNDYLRPRCIGVLERLTGGKVTLQHVRFSPSGHMELTGLSMRVEGMGVRQADRLLEASRVTLHYSTSALWHGRFEPIAVVLHEPTMRLTEDVQTGSFNIERLTPEVDPTQPLPLLPRVYVDRGRFEMGQIDQGRFRVNGQIHLSGQMVGDVEHPGRYQYTLRQLGSPGQAPSDGVVVHGWFDLPQRQGQVSMEGLRFTRTWRDLLPSRARRAWAQFAPEGDLPELTVTYDPQHGRRSQVQLDGVALTLPQLTDQDYRFQLYDVSGRLVFTEKQIAIENLAGKVRDQDLAYRINGTIFGYNDEAPFELSLKTNAFTIPRSVVQIYALPTGVQRVLQKMDPHGQLRVTMKVFRRAERGEVDYLGTASVLNTQAQYDRFAYPLTHCRGLLRFDRNKIEVLNLTGQGSDGATVTLRGTLTPPTENAVVDMTITAVNMPFDDQLYRAFGQQPREALDMFFYRPGEKRLREKGRFISYAQHDAAATRLQELEDQRALLDEHDDAQRLRLDLLIAELQATLARPQFGLGGRCDFIVHLTGGGSEEDDYSVTADVTIKQADILFKHFAYPMRVTGGMLRIEPGQVRFKHLQLAGLYGGTGSLNGQIVLPESQDGPVLPEIDLEAAAIPLDEPFYDAIPTPQDRWVRALKVKGRINVVGRVFADANQQTDVDMLIDLDHTQAAPGEGQYALQDIHGRLQLSLDQVRFDQLTARHGDSRFTISGFADWARSQPMHVKFHATGERMRFQDNLFDLVRPFVSIDKEFEALWSRHQPQGQFDMAMAYDSQAGQSQYDLTVKPASLSFLFKDRRITIEPVDGQVHVQPDQLTLEQLSGQLGAVKFQADGPVKFKPQWDCDVALSLDGRTIDPQWRALMPKALTELVDALAFSGQYQVALTRLRWRPKATSGLRLLASGRIHLAQASMMVGAPIRGLSGDLQLNFQRHVKDDWPTIQLNLRDGQMDVLGRHIANLQATMQSTADSDLLVVPALRGTIYGGVIGGTGRLGVADQSYQFRLALSGVDLVKLVEKTGPAPPAQPAKPSNEKISKGKVSASLDMRGRWNKPDRRQGRGDIQINHAVLYDLPLAMGLLQVANLTLPMSRAFNKAEISYFIKDNQITFERIILRSPSLQLIGTGTMAYDSRKIDLTLTSNNPKAWDLGPVSDILDSLRDQLITIRVTGTADHPQTQVKQFHAITQAWRDVFGDESSDESSGDGS